MNGWLWFLLILLSLLLLLLIIIIITKLTINVYLYHGNDNDQFTIKFRAWFGLIKYKIEIPMVKVDDDGPNVVFEEKTEMGEKPASDTKSQKKKKITPKQVIRSIKDVKTLLEHVFEMHRIIKKFLNKVKIDQVKWNTLVGVADAATTGTLTGVLWSAKGALIGLVSNYMRLQNMPEIMITPSFQKAIIQTEFSCIIQFRIGNAILVGLKIFRYWKGGKVSFKTKPLSHLSSEKHSI